MATTKKDSQATSAASTASTAIVPSSSVPGTDLLAGVFEDDAQIETGTDALASSARIPRWAFNLSTIQGEDGKPKPVHKNVFVQTVSGETKDKLRLQVVVDHPSRRWSERVDGKTLIRCSSWDGVTGMLVQSDESRTERPCANCPDYRWGKDDKGKNVRRCGDMHNLVAFDLDDGTFGIFVVKKTAIKSLKDYYAKYFHKQRTVRDPKSGVARKVDYPFYTFETLVTLDLVTRDGETFAVPVFRLGSNGERMSVESMKAAALALSDWKTSRAAQAAQHDVIEGEMAEPDETPGGGKPDTSFDFGENTASDGMR